MKPISKILLAALSGGFLVLCFPRFDLPWLLPAALVPMLVICYSSKPRAAFLYGWISGAVFFSGLCYWVGLYGAVPLIIMALCIGLFFAAAFTGISIAIRGLPWWSRFLTVPAVWAAIEILRSETGTYSFSYGVIGYAFHDFRPALGLASIIGVYGVSYLAVALSTALLETGLAIKTKRTRQAAFILAGTITVAAILVITGLVMNNTLSDDAGASVKIALVQASIPQDQKWLASKSGVIMDKYESLVVGARRAKPALIILPEAALPAYVGENDELAVRLRSWAVLAGTPMLAGVPLLKDGGAYNTAALFDKRGRQIGAYDKITPVLFGEKIPFRPFSELVYPDFKQMGDISTGSKQTLFRLPENSGFSFGTLICSESMYSRLAIRLAALNPAAIIVITNDGWFYSSNEAELHFAMTKFRAAETGRYIAQAANTGITTIISPAGVAHGEIGLNKTGVFKGSIHVKRGATVFTAGGWMLMYLFIIIIAVAALIVGLVKVCTKPQDASII